MGRGAQLKHAGSIYGAGSPGVPGEAGFIFLLRDGFFTAESAPLADPRTAEYTGHWQVVQAVGVDDFKIVNGYLQRETLTTATAAYLVMSDSAGTPIALTPRVGLAGYIREIADTADRTLFGFAAANNNPSTISTANGGAGVYNNAIFSAASPSVWLDGDDLIVIARNYGGYLFSEDGTLLWVWLDGAAVPLYGMITDALAADQNMADRINIARLTGETSDTIPGNGYAVYGHRDLDITDAAAAPNAADTGDMTPDCLVDFVCSAPTGDTELFVRYIDATHYDSIKIDAAGNLTYNAANGGAPVALITAAGVIAGGETIRAVLIDGDVSLWYNSTLAGTSAGATANSAGVLWELDKEADAVTSLQFRTLDGIANVGSANHPGNGLATYIIPEPLLVGDTFTHEADCMINYWIDQLVTGSGIYLYFRQQDATNYWTIRSFADGSLRLDEIIGGVQNVRAVAGAGTLTGGERITAVFDGVEISVYYDNSLAFSYTSTGNFSTETSGRVAAIGPNGRASTLISWPLSLSNAPLTPGTVRANEARELLIAGG